MAWTPEMIENLKNLWLSGTTTNEIAKTLGLSKNSVVGKVHRLNLEARPSPIKKKEELKKKKTAKKLPQQHQKTAEKQTKSEPKPDNTPKTQKKLGLKLSELDSHTCRWPLGDPKDENFCFCGQKVRAGQTYCDEHAAIAYVKPSKKEK